MKFPSLLLFIAANLAVDVNGQLCEVIGRRGASFFVDDVEVRAGDLVRPGKILRLQCKTAQLPEITEPKSAKCEPDGSWSNPLGTCLRGTSRQDCGDPVAPANGRIDPGDSSVGSKRIVSCDTGYELRGPKRIRCLSALKWTRLGTCEKTTVKVTTTKSTFASTTTKENLDIICEDPPPIENGKLIGPSSRYPLGSSLKIECNSGYTRSGWPRISCQANGKWSIPGSCYKDTPEMSTLYIPQITGMPTMIIPDTTTSTTTSACSTDCVVGIVSGTVIAIAIVVVIILLATGVITC